MDIDERVLAYIAGIMDADGYFTIKRDTYRTRVIKDRENPTYYERVGIKQTSKEAIELIYKYFGGYYHIEKSSAKNGKPLYAVELRNLKAHNFIKAIYPYLRIKKKQAEILLKLRESIRRGKTKRKKTMQRTRWGNYAVFTRYAVDDDEIEYRERLISEIKKLNDSRNDPKHQPKPWK